MADGDTTTVQTEAPVNTNGFWGNVWAGLTGKPGAGGQSPWSWAAKEALYPILGDVPQGTDASAGVTTWVSPATGEQYTAPVGQPPQNSGVVSNKVGADLGLVMLGIASVGLGALLFVFRPGFAVTRFH